MKIATYNVRVDTEYDQDWQWSFRKEAVCQLINFHDWSLCCIQEVRPNQVRDLKAYTTFTCLSAEREGDGQGEGLAILYNEQKVQAIDTGYFWLSETPQQPSIHPEAGCPRIALWGLFKETTQNTPFLVINVHLDHISAHARLAGMTVILEELHDKNLATHYGPRGTFQNFTYTKPWAELEEIDYIYVKGWQVQQTASLTDSIDGRFPSDHFPLEAEVCIEER